MAGLQVIESLDSLWFFSNIFPSVTQNHLPETESPDLNPSGPLNQEIKNHLPETESPDLNPSEPSNQEIMSSDQNQNHIHSETEAQKVIERVESPKSSSPEKEDRNRIRRRKRRINSRLHQKGGILQELDLGEVGDMMENVYGCWMIEETFVHQNMFGNQNHHIKMPPINDGRVMKEHLKSWAYAVACTIK